MENELKRLMDEYREISFKIGFQKIGPNSKADQKLIERKNELKKRITQIKFEEKIKEEVNNDKCKGR